MAQSTVTIVEAQPDWLTGAVIGKRRGDELRELVTPWATQEEADGNQITRWSVQSYQGHRCGRVGLGEGEGDRVLVQLSGDLAATHLHELLPMLDHLTRIDLAVTVRTPEPDFTVAENAFQMACWWYDEHPRSAVPWRIQHRTRGDTAYLGSRESDRFLRIYNKHLECRGHHDAKGALRYDNCWRYELECKGHPASMIAALTDQADDPALYIRGAIGHYLHDHGIEPIYTDDTPSVILPGFSRRSDAESRLYNLGRNVRPSLDWLRDAGYADDAMAALGIGQMSTPEHDKGPMRCRTCGQYHTP